MVLNILTGAVLGLLAQPLSEALARRLLKKRGRECSVAKKERLLLMLLGAAVGGTIGFFTGISADALYLMLCLLAAETVSVTDLKQRLIPNELVLSIIVLTLIFGIPSQLGIKGFPEFSIVRSLIGLAACFVIFTLPALLKKNVGAGDVKLAAAMGFALGFQNSLLAIVLMGLLILGSMFMQKSMPALEYLKTRVPMGPFLAAAMMAVMIYVRVV